MTTTRYNSGAKQGGDGASAEGPQVVELTFLLPRVQLRELECRAEAMGVTVARLLRDVIRDYLSAAPPDPAPPGGTP